MPLEDPQDRDHQQEPERHPDQRRQHDEDECLGPAGDDDRAETRLGDRRSRVAADERVRGTGRQAVIPGDQVPDDRAREAGKDDREGHHVEIDQPLAHRLGDRGAEREGGDEIEERRPDDRLARSEDARRDDRRDRIRGVVEPVDVVEGQRDEDQRDYGEEIGVHRLRVLDDDAFEHVGDVFAAIGGLLEEVEDLLPLDDRDRVLLLFEQAA